MSPTQRDQAAQQEQFMRLFLSNQRRLYSFIFSLVPNVSDADDLLQETVSTMWQKFSTFAPESDFAAWGVTYARFVVLNFYKKRKSRGNTVFGQALIESLAAEVAAANDELDLRHEALRACLAKLPAQARNLIETRYVKGVSGKELAQRLSKSTESIYKAFSRIHDSLLRCVEHRLAMERRR